MTYLRTLAIAALALTFVPHGAAHADVQDEMQRFWGEIGVVNTTAPQAYQSQSAGHYTAGSAYLRTPTRSINPVSITLPSASAGCGGIDLHGGSFSHINGDQFINALKGIANNAKGYAFKLALKATAPLVSEIMDELQAVVDAVNRFNINSCESAKALVGGIWPKNEAASTTICRDLSRKKGYFSDYAKSRHGCDNTDARNNAVNNSKSAGTDEEFTKLDLTNKNLTWEVLSDADFTVGKTTKEVIMNMTGTVIFTPAEDGKTSVYRLPARADDDELLNFFLTGGELDIQGCKLGVTGCLELEGEKVSIPDSKQAFAGIIAGVMDDIRDKIDRDDHTTPLEPNEVSLISLASVPLYRMINLSVAYGNTFSGLNIEAYNEVVALDITNVFIDNLLKSADRYSRNVTHLHGEELLEWQKNLRRLRATIRHRRNAAFTKVADTNKLIERIHHLESALSTRLSATLGTSANYAQ